jgi:hypothetical protein
MLHLNYILSLEEGRTELQADSLVYPYLDKFVTVAGNIQSIQPLGPTSIIRFVHGSTFYTGFFNEA